MTNEDAARERKRIVEEGRIQSEKERNTPIKERAEAEALRNIEKKQQRETATNALQYGNSNLREIANQGGSLGRKLERELKRFEQTGRVSNWLAGETIKAEAAQYSSQQSAFRQAVTDVISTPLSPVNLWPSTPYVARLNRKPEVAEESTGTAAEQNHPFKISFTAPNAITVNAGTINNVVAGNWDELFSFSQTIYVVLTVNAVSNRIVSSVLGVQNSPPAGEESPVKWGTPSQFKVLLGIVINNNIFQIVFNNLAYNALKRITTDRANPQAGLLPYDNWYTWVKISG